MEKCNPTESRLLSHLKNLENLNRELIQLLRQKRLDELQPLLDRRNQISKQITDLCLNIPEADRRQPLGKEVQAQAEVLFQLDQELLIYLDLEIKKKQAKQQLASYRMQRSTYQLSGN